MNKAIFKSWVFWVGFLLYEVSTIVAFILLPNARGIPSWGNVLWKGFGIGLTMLLYYLYASYKTNYMSQAQRDEMLRTMLGCVASLRRLDNLQNLRSNIFIFDRKRKVYRIIAFHNMDSDDDRNVELPQNMGCTGEAWRTKQQVWGPKEHILHVGNHKIPQEQVSKIRLDLEWICSTPITDWAANVIAVLNFDGNKPMSQQQQQEVKQQASRLAGELQHLLAPCRQYLGSRAS